MTDSKLSEFDSKLSEFGSKLSEFERKSAPKKKRKRAHLVPYGPVRHLLIVTEWSRTERREG
jgi:hypothetical protein